MSKAELKAHHTTHYVEIILPEQAQFSLQSALADRGDLIGHGLPAFAVERYVSLGRVEAFDLAGDLARPERG